MPVVVDTNVACVAQGLFPQAGETCQVRCEGRLLEILRAGSVILDRPGRILKEYVDNLGFSGRPGVGKAFVKWVHDQQHNLERCALVPITSLAHGWRRFEEFPNDNALEQFDPGDQKFVAVAIASGANPPVVNATDSDWWEHREALAAHGVRVDFLCPEQFESPRPLPDRRQDRRKRRR